MSQAKLFDLQIPSVVTADLFIRHVNSTLAYVLDSPDCQRALLGRNVYVKLSLYTNLPPPSGPTRSTLPARAVQKHNGHLAIGTGSHDPGNWQEAKPTMASNNRVIPSIKTPNRRVPDPPVVVFDLKKDMEEVPVRKRRKYNKTELEQTNYRRRVGACKRCRGYKQRCTHDPPNALFGDSETEIATEVTNTPDSGIGASLTLNEKAKNNYDGPFVRRPQSQYHLTNDSNTDGLCHVSAQDPGMVHSFSVSSGHITGASGSPRYFPDTKSPPYGGLNAVSMKSNMPIRPNHARKRPAPDSHPWDQEQYRRQKPEEDNPDQNLECPGSLRPTNRSIPGPNFDRTSLDNYNKDTVNHPTFLDPVLGNKEWYATNISPNRTITSESGPPGSDMLSTLQATDSTIPQQSGRMDETMGLSNQSSPAFLELFCESRFTSPVGQGQWNAPKSPFSYGNSF